MADELRIGDAEREQTAAHLRAAFTEGRLDELELEDRLEQAYGAKTASQLVPLTTDLPAQQQVAKRSARSPARAAGTPPIWDPKILGMLAPLVGICVLVTIIWAITTPGGYFWPVWVYLGMSVPAAGAIWGIWVARQRKNNKDDGFEQ